MNKKHKRLFTILVIFIFVILGSNVIYDWLWGGVYYHGLAENDIVKFTALFLLAILIAVDIYGQYLLVWKHDFEIVAHKIRVLTHIYYYALLAGLFFSIIILATGLIEIIYAPEFTHGDFSNIVGYVVIAFIYIYMFASYRKTLDFFNSEISLLFMKGNKAEEDEDFELAVDCWRRIVELEPENCKALMNWGCALGIQAENKNKEEADQLLDIALDKFQRVLEINSKNYFALLGSGSCFKDKGKKRSGKEHEEFFDKAKEKYVKAESIEEGSAAYYLAGIAAKRENEQECKEWLLIGEKAGALETLEHAMKDDDLASVRDKDWFKEIQWVDEEKKSRCVGRSCGLKSYFKRDR